MIKKSNFKKVVFGGYYGQKNIGDDCFGVVSAWGAKNYWQSDDVGLLTSEDIGQGIKKCISTNRYVPGQHLLEMTMHIITSSAVVWSGGSIFHKKDKLWSPKILSTILPRLGCGMVGAIGVSLGPYKSISDEKYTHNLLKNFSFLALRDKKSWEEAVSINLPFDPILASDLALLLPEAFPGSKNMNTEEKVLGLALCHYERYSGKSLEREKMREDALLASLTRLIQNGYNGKFRFFNFNGHPYYGDQHITNHFVNSLKKFTNKIEVIEYVPDPIYFWNLIFKCSAFVSIRLHGGIYSTAANVPCLLIEYHRKCSDFLDDLGLDNNWRISDLPCNEIDLAKKIESLINLSEKEKNSFYPGRTNLIQMAKKNFII